jgi:hypothetical protein
VSLGLSWIGFALVAAFVADLETLVSPDRFERYRPRNRDDLDTMVAYFWNACVSEALLQGIAAIEIALRNSIHSAFTAHAGTDQWFWFVLAQRDRKVAVEHWNKLATTLKKPPTAGKVIADLSFGFWPFLFTHDYKDLWWDNGEALLKAVFPHLPSNPPPHEKIGRKEIFERVSLCRDLRNRAMHHEPIIFGIARPDFGSPPPIITLIDIHRQIVEMLGWIDPQLVLALSFVDRFPSVHRNGQSRLRRLLKKHFNIAW